jgi:hypothetical protein
MSVVRPASVRPAAREAAAAPAPASAVGPRTRLTIGELRVAGVSRRDGERLAQAFEHELARRLGDTPVTRAFSKERLAIDGFAARAGERAEDTGRRLAASIADALTSSRGERR